MGLPTARPLHRGPHDMNGFKRAIVAALAAFSAGCAGDGGGSVLRLGHDQTDGHPYDLAAERFAEGVATATGGALRIRIFPAAQLGDSPEQIEGLHLGTLDMATAARWAKPWTRHAGSTTRSVFSRR